MICSRCEQEGESYKGYKYCKACKREYRKQRYHEVTKKIEVERSKAYEKEHKLEHYVSWVLWKRRRLTQRAADGSI
jgi:tRNA(Ile2) C34 agmatinyltransferase TiaS